MVHVLYESKLAIASSRKDTFTIQPGKYPQPHIVGCIKMCQQNNRNNVTDKSIIVLIADVSHMTRKTDL